MSKLNIEIANSSEYNTEDLRNLVEVVYAVVPANKKDANGIPVPRSYARGDMSKLTFRTWTGEVITEHRYTGTGSMYGKVSSSERKWQGRTTWRKFSDIPLIPADKLYTSPLEAIAAKANGEDVVPQQMVKQLCRYLLEFTEAYGRDRDLVAKVVESLPDIKVRVDRSKVGKVKRDARVVARERLEEYPSSIEYRFSQMARCIRNVHKVTAGVQKEAAALGVTMETTQALHNLYRASEELERVLRDTVSRAQEAE